MKLGRAPTTWRMCMTSAPLPRSCESIGRDHAKPRPLRHAGTTALVRTRLARRMNGERADNREQHGVAGHLQAELDYLLQADGHQRRDCGAAEPPRRSRQIALHAAADLTDEGREAGD